MGGVGSGGHNKKSAVVRELEGNPGHRPIFDDSHEFTGAPTCPSWLSPEAKREWRRIVRELKNLNRNNRSTLAGYCSAYARWRKAEEVLNKQGLVQEARHGSAPRPEVKIAKDSLTQMKAFAVELGLTPKSVIKNLNDDKKPEDDDPLNKALGTRKQRMN